AYSAMYSAKERGRCCYQFYSQSSDLRLLSRLDLESDLRSGLGAGEFVLHYQPRISCHTGQLCGVEALLRWNHPTRGLLEPGEFIEIAEQCGVIVDIGEWVLATACRQ